MIVVLILSAAYVALLAWELKPPKYFWVDPPFSPIIYKTTAPPIELRTELMFNERDHYALMPHDYARYSRRRLIEMMATEMERNNVVYFHERNYKTDYSLAPGTIIVSAHLTIIKDDEFAARRFPKNETAFATI
jgi:hypothetical protein